MSEDQARRTVPLWFRSICALLAAIAFVLVLYPYTGSYYPEGNWLRGPLWLCKTEDRPVGILAVLILLSMVFAFVVKKNTVTIILAVIGMLLWIGIGGYLAMLAIV